MSTITDLDNHATSVVVINYNGGEDLARCLQALKEQDQPLAAVIVVDSGSTDGSAKRVALLFPEVKIIALGENLGSSVARNAGLAVVETTYVLLLDDDVYVRHDTIGNLLRAARRHERAIICPRIIMLPQGDVVHAQGAHIHFTSVMRLHHGYQPLATAPDVSELVGGGISACYFGRTAHLTASGGFDERMFIYYEDMEFSLRMRALGYDFFTAPDAVVEHDLGQGTPGLSFRGQDAYPRRLANYSMRHRWLTILTHYQLRSLLLFAPSLLIYELLTLGFVSSHGWSGDWFRIWYRLWSERDSIRERRRAMQKRRVRPDRDLLVDGAQTFKPWLLEAAWRQRLIRFLSGVFTLNWRLARRLL